MQQENKHFLESYWNDVIQSQDSQDSQDSQESQDSQDSQDSQQMDGIVSCLLHRYTSYIHVVSGQLIDVVT